MNLTSKRAMVWTTVGVAGALLGVSAFAHGPSHPASTPTAKESEPSTHAPMHHHMTPAPAQTDWGIAGDPKAVSRTIKVDMSDKMRFSPGLITVRRGETVRFEISNSGKALHEMVIGTAKELDAHAEMMKKHPAMEHDEAYMAHVEPGKTGEIIWLFNRTGEFDFACLIPGHYQAGMKGKIRVKS